MSFIDTGRGRIHALPRPGWLPHPTLLALIVLLWTAAGAANLVLPH